MTADTEHTENTDHTEELRRLKPTALVWLFCVFCVFCVSSIPGEEARAHCALCARSGSSSLRTHCPERQFGVVTQPTHSDPRVMMSRSRLSLFLSALLLSTSILSAQGPQKPQSPRILIFSKTTVYRHSS